MPASSPQHDDAQYEDALWKLVLYDDTGAPEIISVSGDKFTVGREADNDLALDDLQISRRHLEFTRRDGGLIVEDLHTINGTLLNDEPLAEPRALQPGDLIQIGSIKIRVEGPAQTLPQARVQTQVHAAPAAAAIKTKKRGAKRRLFWLVSAGIILLLVAIGLIGLFGLNWFFSDGVPIVMGQPTRSPGSLDVPKVTINQGPTERSLIRVNQSVTIQAIASDPGGVTRIELWVNNRKVDEIASQLAQNVFSMTAGFQWSAGSPGSYTLQVRAYNRKGLAGVAPVMTLTVVDSLATLTPEPPPTPTPLPSPPPTFTPLPPTPTLSPTPTITLTPGPTPVPPASLMINPAALNVRAGPGTPYEVVGRIDRSNQVEIIGQADLGWGVWWQIPFPAAPGGVGWVSAHSRFTTAANADDVPRIVPLLPTPTATHTPTTPPPTATPTATPVVIRAPEGKTLLIIGNRSLGNQPVRLTLSGGKSVGGGQEIDPPPNQEIQLVLEPDFYRALWSAPSNGFARSFDFTAIPGKVMVMWVVPEQDLAETEIYDELIVNNLDE